MILSLMIFLIYELEILRRLNGLIVTNISTLSFGMHKTKSTKKEVLYLIKKL